MKLGWKGLALGTLMAVTAPAIHNNIYAQNNKNTTGIHEVLSNPYKNPGAAKLYEKYGRETKYKDFFDKLGTGTDIIIDNKRFSLLSAEDNGETIISGDRTDKNGKKGISGVTYMTGQAAMDQAKKQGKSLFKTGNEVLDFIGSLPGETKEDQIRSLAILLGLARSGCRNPDLRDWVGVSSVGYACLSEVIETGYFCEVGLDDTGASLHWSTQEFLNAVVAFEDVKK